MTSPRPVAGANGAAATIWQIDIFPADGQPDRLAATAIEEAGYLGFGNDLTINAARSFLIQAPIDLAAATDIAHRLLVEPVVETCRVAQVGSAELSTVDPPFATLANVMLLPGVTDAQAESARDAMAVLGYDVDAVRTMNRYWISALPDDQRETLFRKVLSNDSIETIVQGTLHIDRLDLGQSYELDVQHVTLDGVSDAGLLEISQQFQLSLSVVEMQTIRAWFQSQQRTPTRIELETVAQTWSEHCSHKTLAGRIEYSDDGGTRHFENMLKETIFAATVQIRKDLGDDDWCVSVFCDNAGIVRFDDEHNVAFKVEPHNRPSALEPYGGANTGIGGVIRDTLGTGLGATGQRLQPRRQLAELVGLGQVVVAAGLEPGDAFVDIVECAENQYRCHVPHASEFLDQRDAVAFGEHPIDDHRVVGVGDGQLQSLLAIGRMLDRMAALRQPLDQIGRRLGIVLHE